jgi:hypothetical protein
MNVFTRDSRTRPSTDSRIGFRFFIGSCMSSRVTPELGLRQIPESAALRSSRYRQLEVPGFCMFATPRLHRIMIPELHAFANPRLRRFQASENRELPVPEKHASRTLSNPDVSSVTGFPEFPNTSPSGKRVDSGDPIPQIFRKFSKKTSPSKRWRGHASPGNPKTVKSRQVSRNYPSSPL